MEREGQDMNQEEIYAALEKVSTAAIIMGAELATAVEAFAAALLEKEMELYRSMQTETDYQDPFSELLKAMNEIAELDLAELIPQQAEDMPPLPPTRISRPPKYIGPVNKANYAANRPPKRARSSCYIRRH